MNPSLFAKAIVAAVLAALTALGTALLDNSIDPIEWVGILTAAITTGAGVYFVPNAVKGGTTTTPGSEDGANPS